MKLSTIFRLTRERMVAHKGTKFDYEHSPYICDNIKALWNFDKVIDEADAERSKKIIEERIGYKFSLENWLLDHGYVRASELHASGTRKKLQDYRHAWLSALEVEFAAIGD